jgi:hypothetical protein
MKTHFIDSDRNLVEGTAQYPANSGFYLVILADGRTSVEPYTVAMGWNNFPAWNVVLSSYLKPLPIL